jgi:EpsI family protein
MALLPDTSATERPPRVGEDHAPSGSDPEGRPASWSSSPRQPQLVLALILTLGALVYRHLVFWDPRTHAAPAIEGWFFLAAETTPQIVFLVVAFLVYRRRQRLRAALESPGAPWVGTALLLGGSALYLWARHVGAVDLEAASLIPVALGAAHLLAGRTVAWLLAAPLALLIFAIPAPAVLMNQIMFSCQLWTARLAEWALGIIGIPTVREGLMLYLSDSTFRVIETCSGLRSIETLTLLAVAYVVFFSAPRIHAAVLIGSAPFIAFLLNGFRVTGLVLIPGADVQSMHILQGAGMFLVGVAGLCLLDWALLRRWPTRAASRAHTTRGADPAEPNAWRPHRSRAWALLVLLTLLGAASLWMPVWTPPAGLGSRLLPPKKLEGFAVRNDREDPLLGAPRFTRISSTLYERAGTSVSLFLGYSNRLRRRASIISPKTELLGPEWTVESRESVELDAGSVQLQALLLRSGPRQVLAYHGYLGNDGLFRESLRAALALDQSPFRRGEGAQVIRLSTEISAAADGVREAHARLQALLEEMVPSF